MLRLILHFKTPEKEIMRKRAPKTIIITNFENRVLPGAF